MNDVKLALDEMVRKGYLKKTKKGYIDSDEVTDLLKQGKTRNDINKMLKKRNKNEKTQL
jgi:hypothetical protein